MSATKTRSVEQALAAVKIVKDHRDKRQLHPADVLLPAMRLLADWAIAERAERQRRIEAAAKEIASMFIEEPKQQVAELIGLVIARCLNGETT